MSKSKKPDPEWSIEERLDAWSERSLSVPIFVVEGADDVVIYREIAKHRSLLHRLSIEAVDESGGGRTRIFQLYNALSANLERKYHLIFFADQDLYVFGSIPEQYKGINFTNGYSIENDLFEDGKDLLMQKLLPEERQRFHSIIRNITWWFAFEVTLFLSNASSAGYKISLLNPNILPVNGLALSPSFLQERNFDAPPEELAERILEGYSHFLRGKFLFQILVRISQDRAETSPFRIGKDEKALWNDCLVEGLRHPDAATHCNRIVSILQSALGPP